MSVRRRLLLTSLITLFVGLAALLVIGNVLLDRRVAAEATDLLTARAQAQIAALDVSAAGITVRETPNDRLLDRQSWILEGDRVLERPAGVAGELDRTAVALGRARGAAERDGPGELRLRSEPVLAPGARDPVGAVVVSLPLAPLERLQQLVLIGSLAVALVVLLVGLLAIRGAVDGVLRPVAEMTADAEQWGASDLDHRFGMGPPRDELTRLAATLDGLLGRIAASRRHEQRFASEIAHELRTPLAALRGRAELALGASGAAADGEREAALRAVVAQADRLGGTVEVLLAVARQELDPTSGAVDVLELARSFEDVEIDAPDALPLAEGDRDVIMRALAPLVENARRHARERVRIELSARGDRVEIAVRDDGPGLDPELGERAFEPGVQGPASTGEGAGLGLPLARRLARSCGGDVIARPGPGGCFVLRLPPVGASGPRDAVR